MRIRLPTKVIAALLAPVVLVAGAAQGLMLMRCGSSVAVAASCCCHETQAPVPASEVVQSAGACCDYLAVPATQPQIEHRSGTPVPAPIAVAVVQEALPLIGALQRTLAVPRLDPPSAPSPLLATCTLLI